MQKIFLHFKSLEICSMRKYKLLKGADSESITGRKIRKRGRKK
jgi:hypothetical protein